MVQNTTDDNGFYNVGFATMKFITLALLLIYQFLSYFAVTFNVGFAIDITFAASYCYTSMMVYIKWLHMIALGNGTMMNNRTRHIQIRQCFVTSKATDSLITIEKIHTDDEVADIFTKPLARDAFLKHSSPMGLEFERQCLLCEVKLISRNSLFQHVRSNHSEINAPKRIQMADYEG